jgi:hypothetical protein
MSNLSFSDIVTSFTIWDFLSELSKPYTQMDIYKAGIIDSHGKFLKDADHYKTDRERRAGNSYNRLIVILKRALMTSSDPLVRYTITNPMAALNALSEEVDGLGGNGKVFLETVMPLFEDVAANSITAGGVSGVGDISISTDENNAGNVVVPNRAAKKYKRSGPTRRKLYEELLLEAKKKTAKKRNVQTTGHMTHVGDWMFYGDPLLPVKHVAAVHSRFHGRETPDHALSLKADGGMSVVLKKHTNGKTAVAYKSGAKEYTSQQEMIDAGEPDYKIKGLSAGLDLVKKMSGLKRGTAVQGDLLFTDPHTGTIKPNAITYQAPHGTSIGFAPHSTYKTKGLDLIKSSSHVDPSHVKAEGTHIPDLRITKETKLNLTPERDTIVRGHLQRAEKILRHAGVSSSLRALSGDKKMRDFLQTYSNEAARTSGVRSVHELKKFIPVYMEKTTQRKLSENTRRKMVQTFHNLIQDHHPHLEAAFTAHGHITSAKHALLDQFKEHTGQFNLTTHAGEEHEGLVSVLGKPGPMETQAKFVREGPGGFPEKNVANSIQTRGK